MEKNWLKELRERLAQKGLTEDAIEEIIQTTMAAQGIEMTPTTEVIALIEIVDHCPGCMKDTKHVQAGRLIKTAKGEVFKLDSTLEVPSNAKVVKRSSQVSLCSYCLRKEQLLTEVEKRLRHDPSFVALLEGIM